MNLEQKIKEYFYHKNSILQEKYSKCLLVTDNPKLYVITDNVDFGVRQYIRSKINHAEQYFITVVPKICKTVDELKSVLIDINTNRIPCMIDLPIDKKLYDYYIKIKPRTDIDGVLNIDEWYNGSGFIKPCTPKAIIDFLDFCKFDYENNFITVVGKGKTVGKPITNLLLDKRANIFILHSKSNSEYKNIALTNSSVVIASSGVCDSIVDKDFKSNNKEIIVFNVGVCQDENGKYREEYIGQLKNIQYTDRKNSVGMLTLLNLFESVFDMYISK